MLAALRRDGHPVVWVALCAWMLAPGLGHLACAGAACDAEASHAGAARDAGASGTAKTTFSSNAAGHAGCGCLPAARQSPPATGSASPGGFSLTAGHATRGGSIPVVTFEPATRGEVAPALHAAADTDCGSECPANAAGAHATCACPCHTPGLIGLAQPLRPDLLTFGPVPASPATAESRPPVPIDHPPRHA